MVLTERKVKDIFKKELERAMPKIIQEVKVQMIKQIRIGLGSKL